MRVPGRIQVEPAPASLFPRSALAPHTHLVQSADPNLRLLNSFLDYLKVEKGLAPLSVSAYRSDLEQYAEFLLKRKRALREARRQDVRDFLNALLVATEWTRAAWRASFRRCGTSTSTCCSIATSSSDPTLNIDTPRQWKVLPKSLATDEVEQVLQGPPRANDDRLSQALRLAIARCWRSSMPERCASRS